VAARDPDIRRASARLAGAVRVAGLDAAGRRAMNEPARAALAQMYRDRARQELGPDATTADVDRRAADLRRVDLRRAALASAQSRRARRDAEAADQQAAELDTLLAAEQVQP
jgi:hypothetical protein